MNLTTKKRQFIEDIGMFFESQRMPRMAGRVIGLLLISDPPVLTAGDIGDMLEISKGSVSTNTRFLLQLGMVEKIGQIGERRDLFRIHPRANELLLLARQDEFKRLHALLTQGITNLESDQPESLKRLKNMQKMCEVAIKDIPKIIIQLQSTDLE